MTPPKDTGAAMGTLAVEGELTIFTAAAWKPRLLGPLEAGTTVAVDLGAVSEIDSAGLQLLILAKKAAATRGKPLQFIHHSPAVLEVLGLTGLEGLFGDPILMEGHA